MAGTLTPTLCGDGLTHSPAARATGARRRSFARRPRLGRDVQAHDVGFELVDHARQRHDVEDTLATSEEVDHLAVRAGQHRAGAGQDEIGRCDVGTQVPAEAFDGPARRLQGDAGVEQLLDHLELEDVGVGVDPSGPAPTCRGHRRLEQAGAGPVVQLAIGDAHEIAHLRTVEPSNVGCRHVSHRTSCAPASVPHGSLSGDDNEVVTQAWFERFRPFELP